MSDKLTIEDLRTYNNESDEQGWRKFPMVRPTTEADLIEVLEGLGAEKVEARRDHWNIHVDSGTYLVWRIE